MGPDPEKELLRRQATRPSTTRLINTFSFRYYNSSTDTGQHGTAIFTNTKPTKIIKSIQVADLDNEGRTLAIVLPDFTIVNSYCPCEGMQRENADKRRRYMDGVTNLLAWLEKPKRGEIVPRSVLWVGDKNGVVGDGDVHPKWFNNPGCQTNDQAEYRQQIAETGLLDVFHHQDPDTAVTEQDRFTWYFTEKDRARRRGVRLDSVHVTKDLLGATASSDLRAHSVRHLQHIGATDHVPVVVQVTWGASELNVPSVWPCWPLPPHEGMEIPKPAPKTPKPAPRRINKALADALEVAWASAQLLIETDTYSLPEDDPSEEQLQEEEEQRLLEHQYEGTKLPIRAAGVRTSANLLSRIPYITIELQATAELEAMKCDVMTDSGAARSIMTSGHLQQRGVTPEQLAAITLSDHGLPIFEMAGGQRQRATCAVRLTFRLPGQDSQGSVDSHVFYVIRNQGSEIILGSDYLDHRQAIISFAERTVSLTLPKPDDNPLEPSQVVLPFSSAANDNAGAAGKERIELSQLRENPRLTLVAPSTIRLPPRSERIIEVIDPAGPRGLQTFGVIRRPLDNLLMERGIATAHGFDHLTVEGTARVAIMNSTSNTVTLRAGEPVCSFQTMEEADAVMKPAPPKMPPDTSRKPMTGKQRRRQRRNQWRAQQSASESHPILSEHVHIYANEQYVMWVTCV